MYVPWIRLALPLPLLLLCWAHLLGSCHALGSSRDVALAATPQYPWADPRHDWPYWYTVHSWYVNEAQAARESGQALPLLFYGDSITQCWRFAVSEESQMEELGAAEQAPHVPAAGLNLPNDAPCKGAPEVFRKYFGDPYNGVVFGIGGDQSPQLMWRLLHGESPAGLQTRVAVLLIGTNDLGYAIDVSVAHMQDITPGVASHITDIASFLTDEDPQLHVLLLAIFQRGNWHHPADMFHQPDDFTPSIDFINSDVQQWADTQERVSFLDCNQLFLKDNGTLIDRSIMPDSLHPNKAGFELLAQCLQPHVAALLASGGSGGSGTSGA